mmetsp:Transcript_23135/g.64273  ORF Transcript_23135/g.64273 Transcript_23135/m.64273 type:complete len:357 (-) Transcript_23135:538-1608(-)
MLRSALRSSAAAARELFSHRADLARTFRRQFSEKPGAQDSSKIKELLEEAALRGTGEGAAPGSAEAAAGEHAAREGRVGAMVGNALTMGGLMASAYFGFYTYMYTADEMDQRLDELSSSDQPVTQAWCAMMDQYMKLRRKSEGWVKEYSDPPTDKLLPDIPPNAIYPRFTVVLDLNETIVHSDWTRGRGWRVFKRPGVEDFISKLAPQVELVVFTDQMATYGEPILERIDPQRMIRFRLYRDSTQYHNGKHVRDLSKLNRNLNQVIYITADKESFQFHPDNAVKIEPWKLQESDTVLLDLIPFIELIVKTNVADVRDVMRSYKDQDIPTAFRNRMEALAARRQQQQPHSFLGIHLR